MKKDIILYTLSTAFSRGGMLIFFPIVSSMLAIGEFGLWSLTLVFINLVIPILCLNGSAAILREGSENLQYTSKLVFFYSLITLIIGSVCFFLSNYFFGIYWINYAFIIATAESLILLITTSLRVFEKPSAYFIINTSKTFIILLAIIYSKLYKFELKDLLFAHSIAVSISLGTTLIYFICYNLKQIHYNKKLPIHVLKYSLLFGITLIPHGISQWIMSSSDRFIILKLSTSTELGKYSIAYNLALILGLLNTALGLTLPVYMIKNYDKWVSKNYDRKIVLLYTFLAIFIFLIILLLYIVDWKYFKILQHYNKSIIVLYLIIYNGLYLLGLYLFYVNYLFYFKQSKKISLFTLIVSLINILLTIGLTIVWGALGAALATLISYLFYLILNRSFALKIESNIYINILKPISWMFISSSIFASGAYLIV